jgi:hypothetical protein
LIEAKEIFHDEIEAFFASVGDSQKYFFIDENNSKDKVRTGYHGTIDYPVLTVEDK